jgi:uncharacterized membrane protein required for colicin V production
VLYLSKFKNNGNNKKLWMIDILFTILCLRISYIAVSRGILVEFFKILGIFFSSIFAFQFYPFLTSLLSNKLSFSNKIYFKFVSFLIIFLIIVIAFTLLRKIIESFFKRQEKEQERASSEKLLSLLVGILRFAFLSSAIIFLLYLLPLKSNYCKGISCRIFKNVAVKAYLVSFNFYNKVIPGNLKLNTEVEKYYETKDSLPRDSKKRG